jgi:small-conductance mechanosensitive channel
VVGVVVAALWVAAAIATGLPLPPLAMVVGLVIGMVVHRSARAGSSGAAIAAGLVALVAIAVGMLFAALAVYSSGKGVSFLAALDLLDGSFLPHLWDEIGGFGAAFGVVGVVLAGLVTLLWEKTPSF